MTIPEHDEAFSGDSNSLRGLQVSETALLRREFDRDTRERLRGLEQRQDRLEHLMTQRMADIAEELHRLADQQTEQGPALEALNTVIHSSLALRWLMIGVVSLLAALATGLTAWEGIKKWL